LALSEEPVEYRDACWRPVRDAEGDDPSPASTSELACNNLNVFYTRVATNAKSSEDVVRKSKT
jgi:hypothetical protein